MVASDYAFLTLAVIGVICAVLSIIGNICLILG